MSAPCAGCVLAEAAPPAPAEGGGESSGPGFSSIWLIGIIFVIFYVLMIRPQSKERKKREEMLKQLKKYDRVVTTAGIHGDVVALAEGTVTLRVDDDVRMTFDRSAIWQVKPREAEGAEAASEKPEAARAGDKGKEKGKA